MKEFWKWMYKKYGYTVNNEKEWNKIYLNAKIHLIGYMIEYLFLNGEFFSIDYYNQNYKKLTMNQYYSQLKKEINNIKIGYWMRLWNESSHSK